jgi:hypothetical protein
MTLLVVGCVAFGALSYDAFAGGQNPSQILLFPTYTTDNGDFCIITITNTATGTEDQGVWVRLVWIDGGEWDEFPGVKCTPEDSWIYLTPRDTFTFVDGYVNPESEEGFLYAYVVTSDEVNSKKPEADPIKGNVLIGQELIFEGNARDEDNNLMVSYGLNAYGFKNLDGPGADYTDEYLFLDGNEFELAPHCVYFPRFFGQKGRMWDSDVILINLTGGRHFTALADVLVYNDNEIPFSTTIEFDCYDNVDIDDISNAVDNNFLRGTDNDEDEPVDGYKGVLGKVETGWMMFESVYATNTFLTKTLDHAAMLAVLIEEVGGSYAAADLPWIETDPVFKNAALWSTHPDGTKTPEP